MENAREFEKKFEYGKGIIPTPAGWIKYFWNVHKNRVREYLNLSIKRADVILFVGVGSGDILPGLDVLGKTVLGIDLNDKFLIEASRYCTPAVADGGMLPFKNGSIDMVVCNMVLHHIVGQGNLENTISECSRVLKDGGMFFACEPNLFHPSGLALTALNKFHLYHAVGGGSDYEYAMSPFRLRRILRRGFKEVRIKAVTFGHPRLPLFIQKLIFRGDRFIQRLYPLSFSFMSEAEK